MVAKTLAATIGVSGPTIAPSLWIKLRDLELKPLVGETSIPIKLAKAEAHFDLATDSGRVDDSVAQVGGGEVHMRATVSLNPPTFDVDLDIPKAVDLEPLLPSRKLRQLVGTPKLKGSLHAFGNQDSQDLDQLDLNLGQLGITGTVNRRADGQLVVQRVGLAMGRSKVSVTGNIYAEDGIYDLSIIGSSKDLDRWLRTSRRPCPGDVGQRNRTPQWHVRQTRR